MPKFSAFLLLLLSSAAFADGLPTGPYIQVSGHGEQHVVPDMLNVSLAIEKTSMDAAAARADVETRAGKVLALLRKLGVADKDIRAPAVTVEPQYEWRSGPGGDGKQVLVGQHVVRGISLTLRDISRYSALADGLFAAGVTRLDGVIPDTSQRALLQQQALAAAVADAHDRAAALARGAGVTLGPVFSIAEQGEERGPRPMMMAAVSQAGASQPEYLSGEIDIGAEVQVYYLIGK